MSLQSLLFRVKNSMKNRERDSVIRLPRGLTECRNISYGKNGCLLDVCYPESTDEALPTIVTVPGGGYVSASKEDYRRYALDLAGKGFSVVNFSYRCAPKWKFPAPLEDLNDVFAWICQNQKSYHLDPSRIVLIGDDAGAQIASQYAAIASNPRYASLFFQVPAVSIRVLGLNSGVYNLQNLGYKFSPSLARDYLGTTDKADPRLDVGGAITESYPPAYFAAGFHDPFRDQMDPAYRFLLHRNVRCGGKVYGSREEEYIGHSFQIEIDDLIAMTCNNEEIEYFRHFL